MELLANVHSCLGNGYLDTGDYNKALSHHTADYDLASEQYDVKTVILRYFSALC